MRRLVFAMMVAGIATLATGCIISSSDDTPPGDDTGFIDAAWSFHTAAGGSLNCPPGFDTAEVSAVPVAGGTPVVDLYDCVAFQGSADYPLDQYDVTITVTTNGGGGVYAESLTQRVDLVPADANVSEDFIDDGGRAIFDWVLVDAGNNPISCAAAGADKVSIINTLVNSTSAVEDTFPCGDGTGITAPIPEGTYTAALDALDGSGGALGSSSTTITNVDITAPNGYTDLGSVSILAE